MSVYTLPSYNLSCLFTRSSGELIRSRPHADQSRYLFSRLLLRKHAWIRRSSLLNSASYTRDISDLATACEGLCQAAVAPVPVVEAGPSDLSDDDKEQIKKKKSASPSLPAAASPVKAADDNAFIDLTLSDSDSDQDKKPPKRSRNGKPVVTPRKGKLAAKPPDPTTPARPSPRKLVSDENGSPRPDLSHFAHDTRHLLLEPPEAILALLSSEELTSLGKKMKIAVRSGASVS